MPAGKWTPWTYVANEARNLREGAWRLRPAGRSEVARDSGEEAKLRRG